jgi:hypothetical protein
MSMTRKEFCGALAGGTVLLLLPGCGGGGSDTSGVAGVPMTGASGCGASGSAISDNHGHELTIASADLDSTVSKTYSIRGSADHDHMVTLTPAMLQQLKAGQAVDLTSTVGSTMYLGMHMHDVIASC